VTGKSGSTPEGRSYNQASNYPTLLLVAGGVTLRSPLCKMGMCSSHGSVLRYTIRSTADVQHQPLSINPCKSRCQFARLESAVVIEFMVYWHNSQHILPPNHVLLICLRTACSNMQSTHQSRKLPGMMAPRNSSSSDRPVRPATITMSSQFNGVKICLFERSVACLREVKGRGTRVRGNAWTWARGLSTMLFHVSEACM